MLTLACMLTVALITSTVGVSRDLVILSCGTLAGAEVIRLALGYGAQASFWKQLSLATQRHEDMLSICDVMDEPLFAEGELVWSALDAVAQSGRSLVAASREESEEYREFVEAWVHEVKTPVAAAKLACENSPSPQSTVVLRELDRMDGYVEQALYYARSGSVEHDYNIRPVEVGALVRKAVKSQMRLLIDAGVRVKMDEGLDLGIFADEKWMTFVMGQVIQNAAKYGARGPQTGNPQTGNPQASEPPTLTFGARIFEQGLANEHVDLTIADNGPGISAADLPRVFEKGFVGQNGRAAGQAKSTGLGLYLVRRLCNKMGVGVRLESEQGAGARAIFSFPTNRSQLVGRS